MCVYYCIPSILLDDSWLKYLIKAELNSSKLFIISTGKNLKWSQMCFKGHNA